MMLIASSSMRASARVGTERRACLMQRSIHSSLRCQETHSNTTPASISSSQSDVPPGLSDQIPPHRRNKGPPSRHKLFYRDIVPPMFRVLALGSAVYFSLHLIWQYLDGKEQKQLEDDVKREMEAKVRESLENRGVIKNSSGTKEGSKGWFSWMTGK